MDAAWTRPRTITVVVDNGSWILPYAERLVNWCNENGDMATLARTHGAVPAGTVAFYLGCVTITPPDVLARNRYNLVVHESALPKGGGFAPTAWQILDGKNTIPVCLIEAAVDVDAGDIYGRAEMRFQGHELSGEVRHAQGDVAIALCTQFLSAPSPPAGERQSGEPSTYPRRRPADSRLDTGKSIAEQFNLLRIVDNERYPAYFDHNGHRYIVRIDKA